MTGKMFSMAALGALAAATPAAAQWNNNVVDTQSLRARIDDGVARGDLSAQDAASLRSQLRGLVDLERRYAEDGLSGSERDDLRQRAQGLRNEIASAEGEAPSGYGRYDNGPTGYRPNGNAYGNQGAYGNGRGGTYDNGAYGDRGYGTEDNGAYGNRGYGRYGNGPDGNRSAPSGAYGDRYGSDQYGPAGADRDDGYRNDVRDDRNTGYDRDDNDDEGYAPRVGDRASGGLYAVPDAYRTRFHDGGGVYYRYGNGNIYQINTRDGVVLRIYPIDR